MTYRIITANGNIKFSGTDNPSHFITPEMAANNCDFPGGDKIYMFNGCDKLFEVLIDKN